MPEVHNGLITSRYTEVTKLPGPSTDHDYFTLPATSHKRKYDEVDDSSVIWEPFETQRSLASIATGPEAFTPLFLLPRSCLPLAYLDTLAPSDLELQNGLFSAQVAALESSSCNGHTYSSPYVLIAKHSTESLYAIERVRPGQYAQCRLGSWVTTNQLEALRSSDGCQAPPPRQLRLDNAHSWWRSIAVQDTGKLQPSTGNTGSKAYQGKILVLRRPGYIVKSPTIPIKGRSSTEAPRPTNAASAQFGAVPPCETEHFPLGQQPLQDPEDILRLIKTQYMESLYRSKASLAYFAKGPLSRARAAFPDHNDGDANPHWLVDYLRGLIVPLNLLDKKYRETLPTLVAELAASCLSDGEGFEGAARLPKDARKSKKQRIGKDGLYPQEDTEVLRWWLDRHELVAACDSAELRNKAIKSMLLEQRARETRLQVILILEILALESVLLVPSIEKPLDEGEGSQPPKAKRKLKKPQDLSTLLDLSADKLCIWQSMAIEEHESSEQSRNTGAANDGLLPVKKPDTDQLREFCIHVILPFFAARLPDTSRILCKKLGGPLAHSPMRPALPKGPPFSKPLKPGATIKRPLPGQTRRTLERVLTDDKRSRRTAPTLSRSATDSLLPSVKRESSDIALSTVPLARHTFHKSNRYSQREVDLTAVSQAAEAKARKKANVELELQGAIAALKRPNPRMAVKEFVEAADQRATAKSRKSKNPVRNPFAQGVQILATPSANRQKNVFGSHQTQPQALFPTRSQLEEIPSSGCTHVPASTEKQQPDVVIESALRTARRSILSEVEQTPSRGLLRFSGLNVAARAANGVQDTPTSSKIACASTPVHDTKQRSTFRKAPSMSDIQVTPSRKSSMDLSRGLPGQAPEAEPVKQLTSISANASRAAKEMELSPLSGGAGESIYKSLGWDDDVDELM